MDIEAFESFLEELTASMEQEGEEGDDKKGKEKDKKKREKKKRRREGES